MGERLALAYATYLGGPGTDRANAVAVDGAGAAYVAGETHSTDFPTEGALQGSNAGGWDGFVAKLEPDGDALAYATYLGGGDGDRAFGVAVDGDGAAYVAGDTSSSDFPTAGAFQGSNAGYSSAFVAKLEPGGDALAYATYLGGSGHDWVIGVAVDGDGAAYVAGGTLSTDFPTEGALQGSHAGASDAFVAKLEPDGDALAYATYLGGSSGDEPNGVAVDGDGAAYVAGETYSSDFPTEGALQGSNAGVWDGFVAKLEPDGDALAYATYLGGSSTDEANGVAVDGDGAAYVAGYTDSTDFPTAGALQGSHAGSSDAFVAKLEPGGDALAYATYLGGSGDDYARAVADGDGAAFVVGFTESTDFPTEGGIQGSNAGGSDAFIAKIDVPPPLEIAPSSASVAPQESVTFEASGGSEAGYVWSLSTNASGGSIDGSTGEYTAGETGEVTDVVMVTDSLDNTATAEVEVGAGVAITPGDASVAPQGSVSFGASGGSGSGYVWSLATNASGGSIDTDTGDYVAGEIGDVTDVVLMTDSLGNTAMATVTVTSGVAVTPEAPSTAPQGSVSFGASGGSGSGYTWSLDTNASGGTIDPSSGEYTAGATGDVNDVVLVTDSLGNTATAEVAVGPGVTVVPADTSVAPLGEVSFEATGGSGSDYVWSLSANESGGSIEADTGEYVAGATGEVTDVVAVTDSLGNTASAQVAVGDALVLAPASVEVPPRGAQAFAASGGSGEYVYSLAMNGSGASIDEGSGEYEAGAMAERTDVVRVEDSLGATATATVEVGPGVAIEPEAPEAPPMGTIAFEATGGSGEGYTWSLQSDGSGGAAIDEEGLYTAGSSEEATDRVRATDSLGNFAEVEVSVGAGIAINPPAPETPPRGAVTFTATGGSGEGHVWAVVDNESGASVDAESGEYTAGPDGASTDTVEVTDSVGNVASVTIEVGPGVSVDPAEAEVEAGGELSLSASGGSGTGYQWSLVTDGSGGAAVSEAGGYTAGPEAGTDVVRVIDSLGNEAEATVTVTAVEAPAADGGCGCRVSSGSDGAGYLLLVGTFGLLVFRRRRRGQVQEGTAGRL